MPRIRFTANPKLPRDMLHLGYKVGTEVELTVDQCERWIRRKVAVYVPAPVATEAPESEPASTEPPATDPPAADPEVTESPVTESPPLPTEAPTKARPKR